MTDPFSITAGAVGTVAAALQGVTALLSDIQAIQNAPTLVKSLEQDIMAVKAVIQLLDLDVEGSKLRTLSPDTQFTLRLATENCGRACDRFRAKIRRWISHSTDERMNWWDRTKVGLFAEPEVSALSEQLRTCKETMNAAVTTATLYGAPTCFHLPVLICFNSLSTIQSSRITDEIRDTLAMKGSELKQALEKTNENAACIDQRLHDMMLEPSPHNSDHYIYGQHEASDELRDRNTGFGIARQLLEELLSDTHSARTGQRLKNIHMEDEGRVLVGFVNTKSNDQQISQDISNVSAVRGGRGIVGVVQNADIEDFFN